MVSTKRYIRAKKILLEKFKDSEILCAMNIKNGFLFSIRPKNTKDYVLDAFFKVTNEGSIEEYSPVMNPKEFRNAMNNVIYSKN